MDIYDLKYWWRDLVSRNQSVFGFNVGFKYVSINLFDEAIGLYIGMPWVWKWCWEAHWFSSVGIFGLMTPFLEIVFVDKLGFVQRLKKKGETE